MGFEQTKWVWMNGDLTPWGDTTIHVSTHALHYGSGVFEGLRCYGPAVFHIEAHLEGFYNSAEIHGMEIPFTIDHLAEAICLVINRNNFKGCYIRPICFYGSDTLALHPRNCPIQVAILAWPWAAYLGADGLHKGVRVTISPWKRFHSQMMPTTAKTCGQYVNSILAVRDADERGYDEALLLDSDGSIAEASGMNLFLVKDGRLLTNDERHSILLGVTRDSVTEIARDLGYVVETTGLQVEDLLSSDEAFLTGTAAEVTPIREVDGTIIGRTCPGKLTRTIRETFFAATGGTGNRSISTG